MGGLVSVRVYGGKLEGDGQVYGERSLERRERLRHPDGEGVHQSRRDSPERRG